MRNGTRMYKFFLSSLCLLMVGAVCLADTKPPKPGLDVWLVSQCPSLPREEDGEPAEALFLGAGLLIGAAIDFAIDTVGDALTKAAKVDKDGKATGVKAPGFMFQMGGAADPASYALPTCVVLAISDSTPGSWCKDESSIFKDQEFCTTSGNTHIKDLLKFPEGSPRRWGALAPTFYTEVELYPSPDNIGLLPRVRALYYPKAIHDVKKFRGSKPRDLSFTLSATTPGGETALTSLLVVLKDIVPDEEMTIRQGGFTNAAGNRRLDHAEPPLWVAVSAPPKKLPKLGEGVYFHPVNITAAVREVGNPNKYLQFIAKAYSENQTKISENLKSRMIRSEVEKAEMNDAVSSLDKQQKVSAAFATAIAGTSKLLEACRAISKEEQKNSVKGLAVYQNWQLAASSQYALRKLELELGTSEPVQLSFDLTNNHYDTDELPKVNCTRLGASAN